LSSANDRQNKGIRGTYGKGGGIEAGTNNVISNSKSMAYG
jgi:hypothetical protein